MYIEIGNSIGDYLEKKEKTELEKNNIEKILYQSVIAAQEGKHCINTESDDCAKKIYRNIESNIVKNFFYYIYQNYSTYLSGLKENLKNYIKIEKSSKKIEKKILSDEKCCTIVNQQLAVNSTFWQSVAFLPENIRDYRFFSRIALFKKHKNYDKIKYSFTREQGQGSRAIDTYEYRCRENKFIFALIDNDISKPNGKIIKDSTADKFNKSKYIKSPFGYVCILSVHELENLFSSKPFIAKVNEHMAEEIEKYGAKSSDVRIYYDFKLGFTYKDLERNPYMKQFNLRGKEPCSYHVSGNCPNRKCQVRVLDGVGADYLEKLFGKDPDLLEDVAVIENKMKNESKELFEQGYNELIDPIKKEWERIYNCFLTYFCSYQVNIAGA